MESGTESQLDNNIKVKELAPTISDSVEVVENINYDLPFNFDKCPSDYSTLKKEAKFLAGLTNCSFLLLAQRLLLIRDNKFYQQDNYKSFSEFIDKELTIKRTTAYNYIDLINYFGVQIFEQKNIEPSKLIYALPLLKSDNVDKLKKDEIKADFITNLTSSSAKQMKTKADNYKIDLKIKKAKKKEFDIVSAISLLLNNIDKDLTESEKEQLKQLPNVDKLKDIINQL